MDPTAFTGRRRRANAVITLLHRRCGPRCNAVQVVREYGFATPDAFARSKRKGYDMVLLRRLIGDVLRERRRAQERTLRQVSASAQVSLGYLSEVERGHKEASSELLGAICEALDVPLSTVLREVSDQLAVAESEAQLPVVQPVDATVTRPLHVTNVAA